MAFPTGLEQPFLGYDPAQGNEYGDTTEAASNGAWLTLVSSSINSTKRFCKSRAGASADGVRSWLLV
ncbi:MAG: hypothetical protein M1570_01095 [Chloroflexi bacterium]|nr:hypothetical protein [Chloroflexota bacterium]